MFEPKIMFSAWFIMDCWWFWRGIVCNSWYIVEILQKVKSYTLRPFFFHFFSDSKLRGHVENNLGTRGSQVIYYGDSFDVYFCSYFFALVFVILSSVHYTRIIIGYQVSYECNTFCTLESHNLHPFLFLVLDLCKWESAGGSGEKAQQAH